jgi:hypothetical protein
MLLTNLADVTTSEPSSSNTDWAEIPYETFDYSGDVNANGYIQYNTRFRDTAEVLQAIGTVSTDTSINIEDGNIASLTIGADLTLSVTNWAPTGNYSELLLVMTNAGAYTLTWPTVNWLKADGSFTTTFSEQDAQLQSSGIDFVFLWTIDSGTTIYGKIVR